MTLTILLWLFFFGPLLLAVFALIGLDVIKPFPPRYARLAGWPKRRPRQGDVIREVGNFDERVVGAVVRKGFNWVLELVPVKGKNSHHFVNKVHGFMVEDWILVSRRKEVAENE